MNDVLQIIEQYNIEIARRISDVIPKEIISLEGIEIEHIHTIISKDYGVRIVHKDITIDMWIDPEDNARIIIDHMIRIDQQLSIYDEKCIDQIVEIMVARLAEYCAPLAKHIRERENNNARGNP